MAPTRARRHVCYGASASPTLRRPPQSLLLLLLLVATKPADICAQMATGGAGCVSQGVRASDALDALVSCYNNLQMNLNTDAQLWAPYDSLAGDLEDADFWASADDLLSAISALEPMAHYYVAAFFSRWPQMFGSAMNDSSFMNWESVNDMFFQHCSNVSLEFSNCALATATPLCPADFANVQWLMTTWSSRYCDVSQRTPKADLLARLRSNFSAVMEPLLCIVNVTVEDADFKDDAEDFIAYFFSDCLDETAFNIWVQQLTSSALMSSDVFTTVRTAMPVLYALARCGMRAFDRYCPGTLDLHWATIMNAIVLPLSNITGSPVTSEDLAWKLPDAAVSGNNLGAPYKLVGWFGGSWLVSGTQSRPVKCATQEESGATTVLLLSNRRQSLSVTTSTGSSKQEPSVWLGFYESDGLNRTLVGTYTLSGQLSTDGRLVVTMQLRAEEDGALPDAPSSPPVMRLSIGNRKAAVVLIRGAPGNYTTVMDRRTSTTFRFYVSRNGDVSVTAQVPKQLLDASLGTLANGCVVQVSGAIYPDPKPTCLRPQCMRNRACTPADCALARSFKAAGLDVVRAMQQF